MTESLTDVEDLLRRTEPVSEDTPVDTLRQWRRDLVHASVIVSYAIGVLSLDAEILKQGLAVSGEADLQSLVDNLPRLLATGWVGGGWSLSPDAIESVAAADELTADYAQGLLGLHERIVSSDLRDPENVRELLDRVQAEKSGLSDFRDRLETRIRGIQGVVLHHYAAGTASVEDWLR